MDREDILLKDYLSKAREVKPSNSFSDAVRRKIELEKILADERREKRANVIYTLSVISGIAVIAAAIWFAAVKYLGTSLPQVPSGKIVSGFITSLESTFTGVDITLWLVMGINIIILTLLGVFFEKRLYSSWKNHS